MARRALAMLCVVAMFGVRAQAQDMTFSLADAGGEPPRPASAQVSEVLARGLRAYAEGHHAEAAVQLQRVVQGDTGDSTEGVRRAQLFLGKALTHMRFDVSALAVFDDLTREGSPTAALDAVLPWLAELSRRIPDGAGVAAVVARFGPEALDGLEADAKAELSFVLGRNAYDQRELARAVELLERVPTGTRLYLRARLLCAVAHVRARHARPAIAAFREVLRALEQDEAGDVEDAQTIADLAWLSLGRVYYTAAHGRGDAETRGRLMGSAVDAWSRVSQQSDYWLDALFESAWALFVSDQHARALGNIHALLSPYFPGAFYPEAHVIKAVTFYHSCQMENASAVVEDFHRRYDRTRDALGDLLASRAGEAPFRLLADVRSGSTRVPAAVRPLLERAFGQRDVRRALAQIDAIAAQTALLERADAPFRSSGLGERIRQDLAVADAFAHDAAGALARERAERVLSELQEIENQMDTVEIEILNWRRQTIGRPPVAPRGGGGRVVVDSEHVIWPFDGEYWRDELGYYRQQVSNRCPAR